MTTSVPTFNTFNLLAQFFYFSHFATRAVYSRPVCSVCSDIRSKSRFLVTPTTFDAPVRGVPVGISPSRLARKN